MSLRKAMLDYVKEGMEFEGAFIEWFSLDVEGEDDRYLIDEFESGDDREGFQEEIMGEYDHLIKHAKELIEIREKGICPSCGEEIY